MVASISEVLNQLAEMDVFTIVIPFLLLFAVIFAILDKSGVLGEKKAVKAIVAASIGILALQFGFVSSFLDTLLPRFGVVIAILLVLVILLGFAKSKDSESDWVYWIVGIGLAILLILWTIPDWDFIQGAWISNWFESYDTVLMWFIIIAVVVGAVVGIAKTGDGNKKKEKDGG